MESLRMRAAVCRKFASELKIENLILNPPEAGEVRVRVSACAICHSDIHAIDGAWGGVLPTVYGHETAGIVESVGSEVEGVNVGDNTVVALIKSCGNCPMCRQGALHLCSIVSPISQRTVLRTTSGEPVKQGLEVAGFAEYVLVDQSQVTVVPDNLAPTSAALLACGVITGLGAVINTAEIPVGSNVAIIGCGGVGLNSIQGAKLSAAKIIVGIDVSEDKLQAAKRFGATHGMLATSTDLVNDIAALTGQIGLDYVFVTVGMVQAVKTAQALLRRGGTIVVVGMPASGIEYPIELAGFAYDEHKLIGSRMGSTNLRRDIPKLVQLYQEEKLRLDELVTGTYRLEDINSAIISVRDGNALRNVIVFN